MSKKLQVIIWAVVTKLIIQITQKSEAK